MIFNVCPLNRKDRILKSCAYYSTQSYVASLYSTVISRALNGTCIVQEPLKDPHGSMCKSDSTGGTGQDESLRVCVRM